MPMSIEKILSVAKKMNIGDRESFVCDHVPAPEELRHLAAELARYHKITPAINWPGDLEIIVDLAKPR